jgi:tRNA(adenine34) deaminase
MTDLHFMQEALKEAAISRDAGDWAIGAIITFENKIIARGRNQVYSSRNRLLHAEMDALQQIQKNYFDRKGKDLTIYTTLEPCPMCFGAILFGGIRRIVAGANFDSSGASAYLDHLPPFFKQPQYKTAFITGLLARDCAEMWASGEPAQKYLQQGYVLPVEIETLRNDTLQTYTTPTVLPVD